MEKIIYLSFLPVLLIFVYFIFQHVKKYQQISKYSKPVFYFVLFLIILIYISGFIIFYINF
jgi:hypothetical protein